MGATFASLKPTFPTHPSTPTFWELLPHAWNYLNMSTLTLFLRPPHSAQQHSPCAPKLFFTHLHSHHLLQFPRRPSFSIHHNRPQHFTQAPHPLHFNPSRLNSAPPVPFLSLTTFILHFPAFTVKSTFHSKHHFKAALAIGTPQEPRTLHSP